MPRFSTTVEQLGPNRVYVLYGGLPDANLGLILETHVRQQFSEEQPGIIRGKRVVPYRRQDAVIIRVWTDRFVSEGWQGFMTHIDEATQTEFDDALQGWLSSREPEADQGPGSGMLRPGGCTTC